MNCDFVPTGKTNKRGEAEMICSRKACKRKVNSRNPPEKTFATCRVPEDPAWAAEQTAKRLTPEQHRELFGDDPTLIGNRIKALTTALGIPPCGGCGQRAAWLNKAHHWLREQFA